MVTLQYLQVHFFLEIHTSDMVMNVAGRLVEACVALHRAIFTVGGEWRREEREKRKARQDGEIFFHGTVMKIVWLEYI